ALIQINASRDQLEADASRLALAQGEAQRRLQQISTDRERETARHQDAVQNLEILASEKMRLEDAAAGEIEQQAAALVLVDEALEQVQTAEGQLNRLMEEVAAADAERAAALRQQSEAEARRSRLEKRAEDVAGQIQQARNEAVDQAVLTSAEMDLEEALEHLENCRDLTEQAERRRLEASQTRDAARESLQSLRAARSGLLAEAEALRDLLGPAPEGAQAPILEQITAVAGYELALGTALGEDLSAPVAVEAPFSWQILPPLTEQPSLPQGCHPLSHFVTAPTALARRLAQIGVVLDNESGERAQAQLAVGQRLVTLGGDLWRWDGFRIKAGAPNAAAALLRQRNRLKELETRIEDAELGLHSAEERARDSAFRVEEEAKAEQSAREATRAAESDCNKLRDSLAKLAQKAASAQAHLDLLAQQSAQIGSDLAEARAEEASANARVASFQPTDGAKDKVSLLRADLAERRTRLVEARGLQDRLRLEAAERQRRIDSIKNEENSWLGRASNAARHQEELGQRAQEAEAELAHLTRLPEEIGQRRQDLLTQQAAAETARQIAEALLTDGEQKLVAADRLLREAEQFLATKREARIRLEAETNAQRQAAEALSLRITERLEMDPEQLLSQMSETSPDTSGNWQRRLEQLQNERENMGPVNLRAEEEAKDLSTQIDSLGKERTDLTSAISKLRQAISEINREGRQRLLASFEAVDQHFRQLFVRLFGGGRAHLALTEANDPLQAGLEIMASPPGKRLQVLSLLSGGEQALTALALLFAVFMTNPAPICVLDEVDAPLDDANVDRFCSLVAEIAQASKTRFLVVTHHRMTMARMDRLFGVTMAERGVSTLVSVDLAAVTLLREPA
ncbi:MAG TPA: chromosome partitioning protein ParA, partial [Rhodospirillaceae bacterium]|nr:chromosome partitioning protein ParA [Rhodospirillaceae bacterium]